MFCQLLRRGEILASVQGVKHRQQPDHSRVQAKAAQEDWPRVGVPRLAHREPSDVLAKVVGAHECEN